MPGLEWLRERPEDVLLPSDAAWADASAGLKQSLDALAKKYTALGGLHVDGLKAEQVWVQAQMVMEGVADELGPALAELRGAAPDGVSDDVSDGVSESESESASESASEIASANESGSEQEDGLEAGSERANLRGLIDDEAEDDEDDDDEEEAEEEEEEEEDDNDEEDEIEGGGPTHGASQDDFDLAEFQQHVLQLEQDPDDSEEIDYGADLQGSSDGDADLHYNDFFLPPAKKSRSERKKKVQFADDDDASAAGETAAAGDRDDVDDDAIIEDVAASTRRDLFDSADEDSADGDGDGAERLSRFEQQQRELARQIEALENENVGEKEWGMRGEIKATQRPQDSLIDADLDFERGSKPAPANTQESTTTLEELIKERIRKQAFDDLPRRSELVEDRAKRELPELAETKSQKSLAELYEDDRMRAENPEYYSKQDSAVLEAAHTEITDLFTSLSRRLDALCSWHYTPKAAAPSLNVVVDQPSISMEDAQPGTLGAQAQLAPQEIYKGDAAVPMANAEMSASMKRQKRRDRARSKSQAASAKAARAPRDKDAMFSALKKGNVTLVDRRGEKRDMRGNAVKEKALPRAANVKL